MSPRRRKNPAAVALGRMTSPAKAEAARANGALGGRPPSRYCAAQQVSAAGVTWVVFDRSTSTSTPAPTYHAARAQAVALNAAEAVPA